MPRSFVRSFTVVPRTPPTQPIYRHLPPIKSLQAASSSTWINRSHLLFFPLEFMKHERMSQSSNSFPYYLMPPILAVALSAIVRLHWMVNGIRGETALMSVVRPGIQMRCDACDRKCARHLLDEVIINVSENSQRHWNGIESDVFMRQICKQQLYTRSNGIFITKIIN